MCETGGKKYSLELSFAAVDAEKMLQKWVGGYADVTSLAAAKTSGHGVL